MKTLRLSTVISLISVISVISMKTSWATDSTVISERDEASNVKTFSSPSSSSQPLIDGNFKDLAPRQVEKIKTLNLLADYNDFKQQKIIDACKHLSPEMITGVHNSFNLDDMIRIYFNTIQDLNGIFGLDLVKLSVINGSGILKGIPTGKKILMLQGFSQLKIDQIGALHRWGILKNVPVGRKLAIMKAVQYTPIQDINMVMNSNDFIGKLSWEKISSLEVDLLLTSHLRYQAS
jgi:hypothetical protein